MGRVFHLASASQLAQLMGHLALILAVIGPFGCAEANESSAGTGGGRQESDAGTDASESDAEAGPCPDLPTREPICFEGESVRGICSCAGHDFSGVCAPDGCSFVCDPCGAGGAGGTGGAGGSGGAGGF